MKKEIKLWYYAGTILETVGKGALITAKADGVVNPMTIGWGTLGIEWNRPIFITMVREHRYSRTMLDENPEFTINVPVGDFDKKRLVQTNEFVRDLKNPLALDICDYGTGR